MKFDLSKPQKLLQESARTLFQRSCSPERVRDLMATPSAHADDLWSEYVDQGWTGMIFPERVDGLGLSLVELAALFEEVGRACVPGSLLSTTCAGILLDGLSSHDLAEQALRQIIEGEARGAVAMHEKEPDWSGQSCGIELRREAGAIVLEGEKSLVAGGVDAAFFLVLVKDEGETALVMVPTERAGVTVEASPGIDTTRTLARLPFDSVAVKEDDILGRGAAVESTLQRMLQVGAVMASADMVGGMQWMLEATVEYAKTREQFGRPIGAYQMVQEQCADMLLLLESSRSATYYAAWALSEGDPDAVRAVSMAKAYCSDACREVGNRAIQVHGGIGFTWEHDLQLYYKRAKASELMFGDATFHREQLAHLLLDK